MYHKDRRLTFGDWTGGRLLENMGTNHGAAPLPFQEWRHFKEAFPPELVARAIEECPRTVTRCLDPFGGSGTTALACQFLGVEPITVEVNPYLADLIAAKLTSYDVDAIVRDLGRVLRTARSGHEDRSSLLPPEAPPTLVEPGVNDRWVFDKAIASRLTALLSAINSLPAEGHKRLFRVLLGGILLGLSNVIVNGKGRRYRQRWKERPRDPDSVEISFSRAVRRAVGDVHRFRARACVESTVVSGDAREELKKLPECDLAVFSPPYPNSFDYTDVYNIELWVLGYLSTRPQDRELRRSTLCSHVQVHRDYPPPPEESPTLRYVMAMLGQRSADLWNRRIIDMVGGYFADLFAVLSQLTEILRPKGQVWLVVGDSRYADVVVPTSQVIAEYAPTVGYDVTVREPFRSMRASAQQGGHHVLSETLLVLTQSQHGHRPLEPASHSSKGTTGAELP